MIPPGTYLCHSIKGIIESLNDFCDSISMETQSRAGLIASAEGGGKKSIFVSAARVDDSIICRARSKTDCAQ